MATIAMAEDRGDVTVLFHSLRQGGQYVESRLLMMVYEWRMARASLRTKRAPGDGL
jgi:hypothetical protein